MTKTGHLDERQIAALAEGRLDASEAGSLRAHLVGCRSCMAAYVDAVRYRAAWLAAPQAFEPSRDMVEAGVAHYRRASSGPPVPGRPRRLGARFTVGRLVLTGVTLTLLAAVIVAIHPLDRWSSTGLRLPAEVRAALESASARGLVLPGGERGANLRGPVLRSGTDFAKRDVEAEVQRELERYERGDHGPAGTYALCAGLIVLGRIDVAHDYLDEGLRRHPRDARLMILRADLAYRENDLPLAARHLRRALELQRDDPLASLDLGVVLAESGARDEAIERFEVAVRRGSPPIASRARHELEALRGR